MTKCPAILAFSFTAFVKCVIIKINNFIGGRFIVKKRLMVYCLIYSIVLNAFNAVSVLASDDIGFKSGIFDYVGKNRNYIDNKYNVVSKDGAWSHGWYFWTLDNDIETIFETKNWPDNTQDGDEDVCFRIGGRLNSIIETENFSGMEVAVFCEKLKNSSTAKITDINFELAQSSGSSYMINGAGEWYARITARVDNKGKIQDSLLIISLDDAQRLSCSSYMWMQNEEVDKDIVVTLNGIELAFDQPPIIQNGRTLVPFRAIFEALGATVNWNDATKTVTAQKDNTKIQITIGDNKLYKNGIPIELDVPAQIVNDRTLVPVRAISEAFGCDVSWDGDTKTVYIIPNENTIIETVSSKWLGKWIADSGESMDIYSVTDQGIVFKFNHYIEDGSLISSDIKMVFDNAEKTVASEIDGSHMYGWEYALVLNDETITMKSRYPDQKYYRAEAGIPSHFSATFTASGEKIGNATVDLKKGFDFVKTDSSHPNYELALTAATLSSQIYPNAKKDMFTKDILEGLGYDHVEMPWGEDGKYKRPVICFAYKHLADGSNVFTVVVRGTDPEDWEDKMTDAGEGITTMFEDSAENVRDELEKFMQRVTGKSSDELKQEKNYFFFTGHSLGGAVANCLSVDNVIKEYASNEKGHIYTYTFESPHTCVHLIGNNPESESNAFNFKVDGDFVTDLWPHPGSTTYGKDVLIHVDELDDAVFNKLFTNSQFTKLDGNVGLHDTCLGLIYLKGLMQ